MPHEVKLTHGNMDKIGRSVPMGTQQAAKPPLNPSLKCGKGPAHNPTLKAGKGPRENPTLTGRKTGSSHGGSGGYE